MDWKLFGQILITFVSAACGWWVVHWLSMRRDLANERRKHRITYLLEAYRTLESWVNRPENDLDKKKIESALSDIQLLGSLEQVAKLREIAKDIETQTIITKETNANFQLLLANLRKSLREELFLKKVDDDIKFFRFKDKENDKNSVAPP